MTTRSFVPFDSLWQMRIDVPYSLLVRDGDRAWSCGQLALDGDSNVLAANDLAGQSTIVAGYIEQVLARGGLTPQHLKRLLLYYVPGETASDDAEQLSLMKSAFRARLGNEVLLDPVPVPHFYYDGIVLEVDAFAGPLLHDHFEWTSVETSASGFDASLDPLQADQVLTAHWFIPASNLTTVAADLETRGLVHDAGAVVSAGDQTGPCRGSIVRVAEADFTEVHVATDDVRLTSRRASGIGWIGARSTDASLNLVAQTEQIMEAIAGRLVEEGVDFAAVVKSTTLYVGGSSERELHDNMSVRNRRYDKPGPASTGLPVFGFADPATRLTVDVTYIAANAIA